MNLQILFCFQEFCLRFIIRESNYTNIIMSTEFETIMQALMVEIIRRRQQTALETPVFDNRVPLYPGKCADITGNKSLTALFNTVIYMQPLQITAATLEL